MNVLRTLNDRIEDTRTEVKASAFWHALEDQGGDPRRARLFLRELFSDIATYQWYTTRAGFKMIGSLPACKRKLMHSLLLHKWEEVEHREWAYRCYVSLGGRRPCIDSRNDALSQTASTVAATWEWMAEHLDPIAYLGAEYLFEKLTALLSADVMPLLQRRQLAGDGTFFISEHVEEDAKHSLLFEKLIERETDGDRIAAAHVLRGFDTFRQIYPLPVWNQLYARAMGEMELVQKAGA